MNNLKKQIKSATTKQQEINALKFKYKEELDSCQQEVTKAVESFRKNFNETFDKISKEMDLKSTIQYSKVEDFEDIFEEISEELNSEFDVDCDEVFDRWFEICSLHNVTSYSNDYISFTTKEYCGEYYEYYNHTIPTEWLFDSTLIENFIRKVLQVILDEENKKEAKEEQIQEQKDRELYEELKNRFENK